MLKRIDKGYAIVYIDEIGDCLKLNNFIPDEIVNDYYNNPGPVQWNYYLIIVHDNINKQFLDIVQNDDEYARKIIVDAKDVDQYIDEKFPNLDELNKHNTLTVCTDDSFVGALNVADKFIGKRQGLDVITSYYREFNDMRSLSIIDNLRADFIRSRLISKIVFVTQNQKEISIIKKKFDFLSDKLTIINDFPTER